MPPDTGSSAAGGEPPAPFLGSPERPVCCAIGGLRDLVAGRLRELGNLGVDYFQLRDREATDGAVERFLTSLAEAAPEILSRVIVNERLALAAAFPVAGVHLPETGLPVAAVRARFPRGRLLIGRSVHAPDTAAAAERDGADYVILGPALPTGGKRPLPAATFREVCGALRIPVWAVGGLTSSTLERLRGAGVCGVAAIRSFADIRCAASLVTTVRRGRLLH